MFVIFFFFGRGFLYLYALHARGMLELKIKILGSYNLQILGKGITVI